MKIFIPIFSFGKGGGNRVLSNLANEWKRLGHDVNFICLDNSNLPYFKTDVNIYWVNDQCNIVKENNYNNPKKKSILNKIILLKKALDKLTSEQDYVIANESLTAYSVYYSRIKSKKVYYIQADEADYSSFGRSIKGLIMSFISRRTYKLDLFRIVNSPIYFRYNNIRSNYYIPPGIDYGIFYPRKTKIKNNIFTLGCIGRFEKYKGTIDVLKAFKILRDSNFKIKLIVAFGDKNSMSEEYLQYQNEIEFVVPNSDVELSEFYNSLDVLISPGLVQHYAHHYPVMEAMACKVATITTGYLPANLANSWIVGTNSPNQIANQIKEIMSFENSSNVETKLQNALESIQAYEWSNIAKNFLDNLKEL